MKNPLLPSDIAVAIGHYNQPGAVALNLAILRKHNPAAHPILVTDDCSPEAAANRLGEECGRYGAELHRGLERLGHVGGDLRAFYHGLTFAKERGCRYLFKLSQRAVFDISGWLMHNAGLLAKVKLPCGGNVAGIGGGAVVAHIRTSTILLDVERWTHPDILKDLMPRNLSGTSCEWLIAKILKEKLGGTYLTIPSISKNLLDTTPGEVWHDRPGSDSTYRQLAARESVVLGPEFHAGGSNVLADGTPDPTYH